MEKPYFVNSYQDQYYCSKFLKNDTEIVTDYVKDDGKSKISEYCSPKMALLKFKPLIPSFRSAEQGLPDHRLLPVSGLPQR